MGLGELSGLHSRMYVDSTLLGYDTAPLGNEISGYIPEEENPKLCT